jgi:hypothetical protein
LPLFVTRRIILNSFLQSKGGPGLSIATLIIFAAAALWLESAPRGFAAAAVTNVAPSFTKGANVVVLEDAGSQTVVSWAKNISAGPAADASQELNFIVTNNNAGLFSAQPALTIVNGTNGTLTFTPAAQSNGVATVTVSLHDNGGTANNGKDTSAAQTFTITVTPVNDVPSFALSTNQLTVSEDTAGTITSLATSISKGPGNESAQTVAFLVTAASTNFFVGQPTVSSAGTLTFKPASNTNGSTTISIRAQDTGGTNFGGVNLSAAQEVTINVTASNDAPSFTKGTNIVVNPGKR